MRSSRILVSIPSISKSNVPNQSNLADHGLEPSWFSSTDRTMDCYKNELFGISPRRLWGINIPHFSLSEHGASGVAGPGMPHNELFCPEEIGDRLSKVCGTYDKWRPYPAEVLTPYAVQVAVKFARKRCKLFKHIAENMEWDTLFYVEHAPSSIAHLDKDVSRLIAQEVMESVFRVAEQWPSVPLVIFSPYGTGDDGGFIVSNLQGDEASGTWEWIRGYLNGSRDNDD